MKLCQQQPRVQWDPYVGLRPQMICILTLRLLPKHNVWACLDYRLWRYKFHNHFPRGSVILFEQEYFTLKPEIFSYGRRSVVSEFCRKMSKTSLADHQSVDSGDGVRLGQSEVWWEHAGFLRPAAHHGDVGHVRHETQGHRSSPAGRDTDTDASDGLLQSSV